MTDNFYELEDLICEHIDEVVKTKDITPAQMECIKNGMKAIYYAEVVDAMRRGSEEEYSRGMSYDHMGDSSYANRRMSYNSYDGRRGRDGDNDGRYSERRMSRGYSGHTKEQLMQQINELQREVEMMK